MSKVDRSGQVTALRHAIAGIEDAMATFAGTGSGMGGRRGTAGKIPLGRGLALDGVLRGGLGHGTLHEVVAARPGDAGAASGFALALAARFAAGRGRRGAPIVWILEDAASAESGAPYAPGLRGHGLDPARLVVVRTRGGADSLWAMEEALKCRAPAAVVLDLWRTKAYDLVASRRLVLAAGRSGTPGILVPAGAAGAAPALSSAAHCRFEVWTAPGPHVASAGGRMPLPGRAAWAVRLARIRAGPSSAHTGTPCDASSGAHADTDSGAHLGAFTSPLAGFDWEKLWPLVWNHEEAWFCDAYPLAPSAAAGDRPHPQTRGRARRAA